VTWDDYADAMGHRPESVSVGLSDGTSTAVRYDGTQVTGITVSPDANGDWSIDYGLLPKYGLSRTNTTAITYTATADDVERYSKAISGTDITYTLTDTSGIETTDVSFQVKWDDNSNADSARPSDTDIGSWTSLILQVSGTPMAATPTVTYSSGDTWTLRYSGVPITHHGQAASYLLVGRGSQGGYTPINESSPYDASSPDDTPLTFVRTVTKTGTITWDDGNNSDGVRPTSLTVPVKAGDAGAQDVYGNAASLTASGSSTAGTWELTTPALRKYDATSQEEISYSFDWPDALTDYAKTSSSDDAVTYRHSYATADITFTVTWVDGSDADGLRPDGTDMDASGAWLTLYDDNLATTAKP
jgi:hypothetical protein